MPLEDGLDRTIAYFDKLLRRRLKTVRDKVVEARSPAVELIDSCRVANRSPERARMPVVVVTGAAA